MKRGLNILAPLRSSSCELSNAAFVINLKAEIRAPDADKLARNDCRSSIQGKGSN